MEGGRNEVGRSVGTDAGDGVRIAEVVGPSLPWESRRTNDRSRWPSRYHRPTGPAGSLVARRRPSAAGSSKLRSKGVRRRRPSRGGDRARRGSDPDDVGAAPPPVLRLGVRAKIAPHLVVQNQVRHRVADGLGIHAGRPGTRDRAKATRDPRRRQVENSVRGPRSRRRSCPAFRRPSCGTVAVGPSRRHLALTRPHTLQLANAPSPRTVGGPLQTSSASIASTAWSMFEPGA